MQDSDFRDALNSEQYEAALAPDGPVLILAAAGTGKTRTLVYRVAYLTSRGVSPGHVLLLTFTNRAAHEMLERAESLVGTRAGGWWGGTFHHMCNRVLRRHAASLGYPSDYTILDRDDSRTLVASCVRERKLRNKEFPKPEVLLSLHSAAVNSSRALDDALKDRFGDVDVDVEDIRKVLQDYESRKRKQNAMDFDDLLVNGVRLLREHGEVQDQYQHQFRYVLVDEYQDTNPIQAELVDRLAGRHRNLMVVGDDFQSIYSWRGADFRNIMSFPERYPDAKVVKLETNYRSVPEILSVANACIAGNPQQFQKTLRPTRESHHKPLVAYMPDGAAQAHFVVETVRELCSEGYDLSDIAVLYRAHYHAMELQMELTRQRVAYTIMSGLRFFEQAHVKDVLSLLRVLESPSDQIAFMRLLMLFPGVGERTAEKIMERAGGKFDALDAAARGLVGRLLRADAALEWNEISAIMGRYEATGRNAGSTMEQFVEAFYERHAVNTFDNADRRLEDIRELIAYADKFESTERLLSEVALMTNLDAEAEDVNARALSTLRLSTVHQAKGLEWQAVIILWMTEGMFPSSRSLSESEAAEAEERRLFYVAITRAKSELCLCVPQVRRMRDGGVMPCQSSRFLTELPQGLVRTKRPGFY